MPGWTLFRRPVPPWVRHLAREVQERSREGVLVPQDYAIEPALPPPAAVVEERPRLRFLALACGGLTLLTPCALQLPRRASCAACGPRFHVA